MINRIKNAVEERTGRQFRLNEVRKNNGLVLTGLTEEGKQVAATVYINDAVKRIEEGYDFDEVIDELVDTFEKNSTPPEFDIDKVLTWPCTIIPKLVNKERNKDLLENLIYEDIPGTDLAMYYTVFVASIGNSQGTIKVDKPVFERLGCTFDELKAAADAYTEENMTVKGMSEVLLDMIGKEQAMLMGIPETNPEDDMMLVISTKSQIYGAASILKAYDKISAIYGDDFFVLPSSVHEVIAVKGTENFDAKELRAMVEDVNGTQVSEEEQLSDNVYRLTKNGLTLVTA